MHAKPALADFSLGHPCLSIFLILWGQWLSLANHIHLIMLLALPLSWSTLLALCTVSHKRSIYFITSTILQSTTGDLEHLLFSSLNPGSCAWHYSICLSLDTDLLRASLFSPHHVVSSYKPMTDNLWDSLYIRLCITTRLLYMSTWLYHSIHNLLTLRPAFTIHDSTSLFSRPTL
jgi:hypothetical protein